MVFSRLSLRLVLISIVMGICGVFACIPYKYQDGAESKQVSGKTKDSAPSSNPVPGQEWKDPISGIGFVWIPPGSFSMGSKLGTQRCDDEIPEHTVTINKGFWLGKFEVTQAEWRAVMGDNPSYWQRDDLPVEAVSWLDAQGFVNRLTSKGSGRYRLPTEAEWEYACRAGSITRYYWGEEFDDSHCWWAKNSGGKTNLVGQKKPNSWGLYDMSGNVNEWCEDVWHDNYNGAPIDGSAWTSGADPAIRVLRGGTWNADSELFLRSADRFAAAQGLPSFYSGLRIVRLP